MTILIDIHSQGFDWNRLQTVSPQDPLRVLFSACLLGNPTNWEGGPYTEPLALKFAKLACVKAVHFCPEDFSLGTPRPLTTIFGGHGKDVWRGKAKVLETTGRDVTEAIKSGAQAMLACAQQAQVELAILMDVSDSCGSHVVYLGDPKVRQFQQGPGVAAALLIQAGISVMAHRDYATFQRLLMTLDPSFVPQAEILDFEDTPWFQNYFKAGPIGLPEEEYEAQNKQ